MSRGRIALLALVLAGWTAVAEADQAAGAAAARRTANDGNVILEAIPEIPEDLGEKLRAYQNVRSARFLDWTADGDGIYVSTRFGSVDQIHHVAMRGGARRQLTFFAEPVRSARRQSGGALLSFLMDEGGSELYQIHLFDPATGSHRRLTDGESRNGSPEWSRDGRHVAFTSTRRNGRSNDVWVMPVDDPAAARLVVEAPGGTRWSAADWSADGRRLLIQQYVSANDSRVHLLDLESGGLKLVAGGDEQPSANLEPRFDAGGAGVFLVTDQASELTQLAWLSLATGDLEIVTADVSWNVEDAALSDDRRRAAFTVNEDGIGRLYLMDPASRRYRRVDRLPTGVIRSLRFSPDGRRLALTINTAKTPSDVFVLDLVEDDGLTAGELVRWTYSEVGGLDTEGFVEPQLVHYPTFDEVAGAPRRIPAFVYKPRGQGPHPVIVSIHGGPEGQYRPSFSDRIQLWVDRLGAAVIAPNVRGSRGYGKAYLKLDNGFKREDSVKDIGALLDWIAAQPDLDQDRVAVYGGSYGGYMVLASLVHYSDRLRAGVDVVGISNFVTFLENTRDYRRDLRRVEYGDERDAEMRAFLERISPNRNAAKITAPLLVAQGVNDPRVPVTESEQIVRDVRAAGYDVWYMKALNEGHGFRKKENRDLFGEVMMLFLEQHLLGREASAGADTASP